MKQPPYRSLAEISLAKATVQAAIEQQQAVIAKRLEHNTLPLLEGVWFGIKLQRIVQNISREMKQLFSPKGHL